MAKAAEEKKVKDVFSINELDETNTFLSDFNNFLINHEDWDEVRITTAVITIVDSEGTLIGTFSKYSDEEDVKFEPNFDFSVAQFGE
jgi:hypothetical protein